MQFFQTFLAPADVTTLTYSVVFNNNDDPDLTATSIR